MNAENKTVSNVAIYHSEQGFDETSFTFGAYITVGDLVEALQTVPADYELDTLTTLYFNGGDETCEGSELPDEIHDVFISTLTVSPKVWVNPDDNGQPEGRPVTELVAEATEYLKLHNPELLRNDNDENSS